VRTTLVHPSLGSTVLPFLTDPRVVLRKTIQDLGPVQRGHVDNSSEHFMARPPDLVMQILYHGGQPVYVI
jgi:hypothetical protein